MSSQIPKCLYCYKERPDDAEPCRDCGHNWPSREAYEAAKEPDLEADLERARVITEDLAAKHLALRDGVAKIAANLRHVSLGEVSLTEIARELEDLLEGRP